MLRIELPGWAIEKRNAIDGSRRRLPIEFACVAVGLSQRGDVLVTVVAWVNEDGKLTVYPNPDIIKDDGKEHS